jgi:hypothetical protein
MGEASGRDRRGVRAGVGSAVLTDHGRADLHDFGRDRWADLIVLGAHISRDGDDSDVLGVLPAKCDTGDMVEFESSVSRVGATTLVRLPEEASKSLPSRGQVSVRGTLNGHEFQTVVEPDGRRGHWIRLSPELEGVVGADDGRTLSVAIEPTSEWPEPSVPSDLAAALAAATPEVQERWRDITPMARWEWVRWVNATANPSTRERRVEVSISKLDDGKRRPCCFDLSACTDPSVAKSGKLIVST